MKDVERVLAPLHVSTNARHHAGCMEPMFAQEMSQVCFANRLRAASRAMSRHYDAACKDLDLKVLQVSVLAAVSLGKGEAPIIEIAEKLGMDRSTLSRNFEPLERKNRVLVGPEGRHRARLVSVTGDGDKLLRKAYPIWRAAQRTVAAKITDMPETSDRLLPIIEHFGGAQSG